MKTLAITETMEQVHKHCEKYLALHREITSETEVLHRAIRERWGNVDPREVLVQAELNSLAAARMRFISDPRKNAFIETNAQGDLFHQVSVKVPSILMVDGKPRPYYEASILDGLEYWRARQDAKAQESDRYFEAATASKRQSVDADDEASKLEAIARTGPGI